jgi:hypothetical protein
MLKSSFNELRSGSKNRVYQSGLDTRFLKHKTMDYTAPPPTPDKKKANLLPQSHGHLVQYCICVYLIFCL